MLVDIERRNYSLYARPDRLLFGYFEAEEDFAASLAGMSNEDVNVLGPSYTVRHVLPHMRRAGDGAIVNLWGDME